MAGSINKVILIGNLGKDPEIRRTQDGRPIATLSIATSETWRDKNTQERKERTEWHRVVIFNEGLCRVVEQYLKKGAKVYIEGSLQTRKWQDQQGVERYSTEVVLQNFSHTLTMLDGRRDGMGGGMGDHDQGGYASGAGYSGGGGGYSEMGSGMGGGGGMGGEPPRRVASASSAPSGAPAGRPTSAPAGAGAGAANGKSFDKPLDDEIPF